MIHPPCVNNFQKNDTLDLTDLLCLRELCFFCLIRLHSALLQKVLQLFLTHSLAFFRRRKFHHWNHIVEIHIQPFDIPLFRICLRRSKPVCDIFHILCDHIVDRIAHALTVEHAASLSVNDLSLFIHDLIILKQVLTDTKVVDLQLFLCCLNGIGKHFVLDLLAVFYAQRVEHSHEAFGAEQPEQVILQGYIESGLSRISLTSGTASQLVINTP